MAIQRQIGQTGQIKRVIKTTEKIPKNIKTTEAGDWLKTLTPTERDKLDKKVKKMIVEHNFLHSSSFPLRTKYAVLTQEEISIKSNEFKSNNIRPPSRDAKRFFSFWRTGRNLRNRLMRELFPKRFFDKDMLSDDSLADIREIKRRREEYEQSRISN